MFTKHSLFISVSCITLFSCSKETPLEPAAAAETMDVSLISTTDKPGKYFDEARGICKLVLQPGDDGQDALIQWKIDDPNNVNSNAGALDELDAFEWTVNGALVGGRSLLKFTGLNQIPSTAKILDAKLFLHGQGTSIPLPQGNSSYPGSPYNVYGNNSLYIQRVTSSWDESTVTWNTRPQVTKFNEAITSPSTSQWYFNTSVEVTDFVKPMIKSPEANNGFMLRLVDESVYRSIIFSSSENVNTAGRPKIVVVYKL